jgi:hypothetical protein
VAFNFPLSEKKVLLAKVALSSTSEIGARKNMQAEIPGWDFEKVLAKAEQKWDAQLGKVNAEFPMPDEKTTFYTALYHNFVVPNVLADVDGSYRGMDDKVHHDADHEQYTVFSIWDTYRATHPLYTILEQRRTVDFIKTFLRQYEQGGRLPIWELWANETDCMIGYHAVSVIADAYLKEIRDFDAHHALEAMVAFAETNEYGKRDYIANQFIPSESEHESVSKTLEYAYNDWCIAQMAGSLGRDSVYRTFMSRAQSYKNIFDPATQFMRARNRQFWFTPFDPREVNFNYTEANSWQYSFYVPQDLAGFTSLLGGRDALEQRLDALFSENSQTTGRHQADITGLIGQYAHGNEPSHHIAYLYNFVGKPWKTQSTVNQIKRSLYHSAPDGLSGNEDCGQMSAWYVFSALGFYPVTPCTDLYIIGTPSVKLASLSLENGKTFTVRSVNLSAKNHYVQSVRLNGHPLHRSYIRHGEIMAGGILEFEMGPAANTSWATDEADIPSTSIDTFLIVPIPAISRGKRFFFERDTFSLNVACPDCKIQYTTDGTDPARQGTGYRGPFVLEASSKIKAVAVHPLLGNSLTMETEVARIPKTRKITLKNAFAPQYSAGGESALIDFEVGGQDFRTGQWQGYEGVDLDATIDLGKKTSVKMVNITCLQDENAWIFLPTWVEFFSSADGANFTPIATVATDVAPTETGVILKKFEASVAGEARYLRVRAVNMGHCPDWHKGAGGKAWIFADEISILE